VDASWLRVGSLVEDVIRLVIGPQQRLNTLPQFQIGPALAVQDGAASGGLGLFQGGQKDLFHTADIGGHDELLSKAFTLISAFRVQSVSRSLDFSWA
jgi:hypothetical protein